MENIKLTSLNYIDLNDYYGYKSCTFEDMNGEQHTISVKKNMTISEVVSFVGTVVSMCVTDRKYYRSKLKFAFNSCVLMYVTNLDCDVEMDEMYPYANDKHLMDCVFENSNVAWLMDVCDKSCEQATDSAKAVFDRIIEFLKGVDELSEYANNNELIAKMIDSIGGGT